MALTQGLLAKLMADQAQLELRGSAFGPFNLASGVALLFASVVAGPVWDHAGPDGTFLTAAAFTATALVLVARYGTQGQVGAEVRSTQALPNDAAR